VKRTIARNSAGCRDAQRWSLSRSSQEFAGWKSALYRPCGLHGARGGLLPSTEWLLPEAEQTIGASASQLRMHSRAARSFASTRRSYRTPWLRLLSRFVTGASNVSRQALRLNRVVSSNYRICAE
jgi:hypothetical protein